MGKAEQASQDFYSFDVKASNGTAFDLSKYRGKVVLVVNVASKCGFTPQYEGLEALYQKYKDHGLVILGFPCNQFGSQEPGTDQEIQQFCGLTYNVTFPVLAKVEVNGKGAAPIYDWLKASAPGVLGTKSIKWNFTKFLVGKDGKVIRRYAPSDKPADLDGDVAQALAAN